MSRLNADRRDNLAGRDRVDSRYRLENPRRVGCGSHLVAIVRSITVTPIIASVSVGRGQPGAIVVSMNSHFLLMNSQLSLAFRMSSDRAEERDQSDIHRAARIHPKCN
jgi:hypothetical protein